MCTVVHYMNAGNQQYTPAHIDVLIGKTPFRLLVDTKASVSLIQGEFYDKLVRRREISDKIEPWNRGQIGTAARNSMKVRGIAKITVDLSDKVPFIMLLAVVNGLSKSLIISVNALNKTDTKIDMQKKTITFANKHIFNIDIGHNETYTTDYYPSDNSYENWSEANNVETYDNMTGTASDSEDDNFSPCITPNSSEDRASKTKTSYFVHTVYGETQTIKTRAFLNEISKISKNSTHFSASEEESDNPSSLIGDSENDTESNRSFSLNRESDSDNSIPNISYNNNICSDADSYSDLETEDSVTYTDTEEDEKPNNEGWG